MDDLISRQEAIDAIVAWTVEDRPDIEMPTDLVGRINALPSAQPEHKHGKWVFVRGEEAGNALYMCSACGKGDIHAPEVKVSYCWNCGAEMTQEGGS